MPRLEDLMPNGEWLRRNGSGVVDAQTDAELAAIVAAAPAAQAILDARYGPGGTLDLLDPAAADALYEPLINQMWIPASAFAQVAGGTAFEVIGSSSALRWKGWSLDATATESIFWAGVLPDHWTACDVYIALANPAASAGNVVLTLTHTNATDGGSMNSEVADGAVVIAASGQYIMAIELLKAASTAAGNRIVRFEVQREGGHASDTLANDILVMGMLLRSTAAPVGWLQ